MSGSVDVLAVMREAASAIAIYRESFGEGPGIADELDRARAAVGELISKADDAETLLSNLIAAGQVDARYGDHVTDLTAAIAGVGGAA